MSAVICLCGTLLNSPKLALASASSCLFDYKKYVDEHLLSLLFSDACFDLIPMPLSRNCTG